jgi:hypothetical protein
MSAWEFGDVAQFQDGGRDCVSPVCRRLIDARKPEQAVLAELASKYIAPLAEAVPELAEFRRLRAQVAELQRQLEVAETNVQALDIDRKRAALTLPPGELPARLEEIAEKQQRESEWVSKLRTTIKELNPLLRDARNVAAFALDGVHGRATVAVTAELNKRAAAVQAELRAKLTPHLDELVAIAQEKRVFGSRELMNAARRHLDLPAPANDTARDSQAENT